MQGDLTGQGDKLPSDWASERLVEIYSWRRLGIGPKHYDWRRINRKNGQIVCGSERQGYSDFVYATKRAREENPGIAIINADEVTVEMLEE